MLELVAIPNLKVPLEIPIYRKKDPRVRINTSRLSTSFKKEFGEKFYEGWSYGSQETSHAYKLCQMDVYKYYDETGTVYRINPFREGVTHSFSIYSKSINSPKKYTLDVGVMLGLDKGNIGWLQMKLEDSSQDYIIVVQRDVSDIETRVAWKCLRTKNGEENGKKEN